jgi:hypothetical protein
MKSRAIATGLWLAISRRLNSAEFVQITGHGVEAIERRALLKPGGLLRTLEWYKQSDAHAENESGFSSFVMFLMMEFVDPHAKHATGQDRDYWLAQFSKE